MCKIHVHSDSELELGPEVVTEAAVWMGCNLVALVIQPRTNEAGLFLDDLPSGKLLHNYGTSPSLMGNHYGKRWKITTSNG